VRDTQRVEETDERGEVRQMDDFFQFNFSLQCDEIQSEISIYNIRLNLRDSAETPLFLFSKKRCR
jgi:hypothetical protein